MGVWSDDTLSMTAEPTTYVHPLLTEKPTSEVTSTCEGDNCPYIEWWLYDIPLIFEQTKEVTGRTSHLIFSMHDKYEGDGKCSGKTIIDRPLLLDRLSISILPIGGVL